MSPGRLDVAVIGAGAAGLTAAFLLRNRHNVTLFEQDRRVGGHAHTVLVESGHDAGLPLDVGFMVFNAANYPHFCRLLTDLGVTAWRPGDMSFGYHDTGRNLAYVFNRDMRSLGRSPATPDRPGAVHPAWVGPDPDLLGAILRFMRRAARDLAAGALRGLSLGEYVRAAGYSERVLSDYLVPLSSSLWSADGGAVLAAPADFVIGFLASHRMLEAEVDPGWRTVEGGSRVYVKAIAAALGDRVKAGTRIHSVSRVGDGCELRDGDGLGLTFDAVVMAAHADEALALLADPRDREYQALSPWTYRHNMGVLHSDPAVMPADRRLWASWNYSRCDVEARGPSVTYYLNRLQGHGEAGADYFLSLNPPRQPAEDRILATVSFTHPVFSREALETRPQLEALNRGGTRTFFCGSYFGYGFHEDAVRSAFEVARELGAAA